MKIDCVISIGDFCFWAHFLRAMHVRTAAFPFDWMFSNLAFVIDCIQTDFSQIKNCLGSQTAQCASKYVEFPFATASFPHHNLKQPENREHFVRAITRWNKILEKESNCQVLFTHMSANMAKHDQENLFKFANAVKERYKHTNFAILSLCYAENAEKAATYEVKTEKKEDVEFYYIKVFTEKLPNHENWASSVSLGTLIQTFFTKNQLTGEIDAQFISQ